MAGAGAANCLSRVVNARSTSAANAASAAPGSGFLCQSPQPGEKSKQGFLGFCHAGPNVKTTSAWARGWEGIGGGCCGKGQREGNPGAARGRREELRERLELQQKGRNR